MATTVTTAQASDIHDAMVRDARVEANIGYQAEANALLEDADALFAAIQAATGDVELPEAAVLYARDEMGVL